MSPEQVAPANERIEACLAACDGIPTDTLREGGMPYALLQAAREALDERDELLRALQRLTHPAADDDDVAHALSLIRTFGSAT